MNNKPTTTSPQSYAKTVKGKSPSTTSPVTSSGVSNQNGKQRPNSSPKQLKETPITAFINNQGQPSQAQQNLEQQAFSTPSLPFALPPSNNGTEPVLNHIQRERLLFVFFNMIGQIVEVLVTNGKVYEGLFHALNTDGMYEQNSILLKWSREKTSKYNEIQRPVENFRIMLKDVVQIKASDIFFTKEKQQYFREESFVCYFCLYIFFLLSVA